MVGMFGVRLGVEVKSLSVANIGKLIGEPIVLPGSDGGVDMLRYRYDYPGNRGIWDGFSFDIRNQDDNHKVLRVEVFKSYENEQSALSGAQDFCDYILAKYGVSLVKNPLAQNGQVWLQMFEQQHDTVLMSVRVYEKDGKYQLAYSLLGLPRKDANQE